MSSREERVAKNEATSREMNEHIDEAYGDNPPSQYVRMVCECGYPTCERVVAITQEEYETLRGDPQRFAVVPEHVIEDVERVVDETDRYVIVAKRDGPAADEEPRA